MSDFAPSSTFANARKVAGISDSRQVRDVVFGNAVTYARQRFLSLFSDSIPGQDKKAVSTVPVIKSRGVKTLTPEKYDVDLAPPTFELMTATSAVDVAGTATLTLNSTAGLEVGMTINNPGQSAAAIITAVTSTTIDITVTYSAAGSVVWAAGSGVKNLEKLNSAFADAPTVGVGGYREPNQITNNLQFSYVALSQGILQSLLALHGNMDDNEMGDYKAEQKLRFMDFQRMREAQLLLSQGATSTGSGSTRVMYAKGLVGFAGGIIPNANPGGALSFEDFMGTNMAGAREGGGSFDTWGFCGSKVATALTMLMHQKVQITNVSDTYKANYRRFETPNGNLNLVVCDAFDSAVRAGQMLTMIPEDMERVFLKGLDIKYLEGLEINNILGVRAAYAVCEAMLPSRTLSLKLHTGILKAA